MGRLTRVLMAIGLTACLLRPLCAAPARPAAEQLLAQDPRLAATVVLRLKRTALSEVVRLIGRQLGVSLNASPEVADEPAIIYSKGQAAKEVMLRLATLFNYRWRRDGVPEHYSYTIYQDLRSKQEEAMLRGGAELRAVRALRSAIHQRLGLADRPAEALRREASAREESTAAAVQQFSRSASEGANGASRTAGPRALVLQDQSIHLLREMTDPLNRVLVRIVASLSESSWTTLANGTTLRLSTRPQPGCLPLPQPLAVELRASRPSRFPTLGRLRFASAEDEKDYNQEEKNLQREWLDAGDFRVTAWLEVTHHGRTALDLASSPGADPALDATLHVMPRALLAREPSPFGLVISSTEVETAQGAAPELPPASDSDPVLAAQARLNTGATAGLQSETATSSLNELLPKIAESFGINIIADAYRNQPFHLPFSIAEKHSLLDTLNTCVLPGATWSRASSFFLVRQRHWYQTRLADVPDRVLREWATHLRTQKRLSLEDAIRLVLSLRDEQIENFLVGMREQGIRLASGRQDEIGRAADVLRAYGCLTPAQRDALDTGRSVAWAAVPPDAQLWFGAALQQREHVPLDPVVRILYGLPGSLDAQVPPQAITLERVFMVPVAPWTHRAGSNGAVAPAGGEGTTADRLDFGLRYDDAGTQQQVFGIYLPAIEIEVPKGTARPSRAK